jgi:hypothetical protein
LPNAIFRNVDWFVTKAEFSLVLPFSLDEFFDRLEIVLQAVAQVCIFETE